MLKPGGELVYSVCSFEPEETTHQLEWLLETFSGKIEVIQITNRLQDYYKKYVTRDEVLIVFAGNPDGMDGFGAFIVKKI
jgi:16S rRNA (cytosine967-C5)-methyltransferase